MFPMLACACSVGDQKTIPGPRSLRPLLGETERTLTLADSRNDAHQAHRTEVGVTSRPAERSTVAGRFVAIATRLLLHDG